MNLVRLQSFVTRYRPFPNENSLLRHIDGAHVDGSVILGLPTDHPFEGGGVTVWESARTGTQCTVGERKNELTYRYPLHPGDMCMLDNYVWHQGNPITSGERWSLVIFYAVKRAPNTNRLLRIVKKAADSKKQSEVN